MAISPTTVRYVLTVLRRALRDAVPELLARNPVDNAARPRVEKPQLTTWSPEEAAQFIAAVIDGAWNGELLTAMRTQLLDRYMRDTASTRGIYIVAWPDLPSWTDIADNRRTKFASLDRAAIEAALAAKAADVARQGAHVQVLHLDIAYRRPEYGADEDDDPNDGSGCSSGTTDRPGAR